MTSIVRVLELIKEKRMLSPDFLVVSIVVCKLR